MRILLIGYGRMGRLVGELAGQYGCEVKGVVDPESPSHSGPIDDPRWLGVDVAIDFSTAEAVVGNVPALAQRGIDIVLGTTGWQQHGPVLHVAIEQAGTGMVAAPNFSPGVVLFESIVARAARLFATRAEFDAFLHEAHHAAKRDAPSGTALRLERVMHEAGYTRPVDVSSTRAGHIPGTHTVGFDGPSESITLAHMARDRSAFARGALMAAQWVRGKRGWFTMQDVLGLDGPDAPERS